MFIVFIILLIVSRLSAKACRKDGDCLRLQRRARQGERRGFGALRELLFRITREGPLVAFIDRKGNIRYQSNPVGTEVLHSEARMRQIIEELLKEPAGTMSKAAPKKG